MAIDFPRFSITPSCPAMPAVSVSGIRKSFGAVVACDGVDLSIGDGELLALLGPSGCGKTTLLRMLAGLLQPDAGRIRFGEDDVTRLPAERRGIGMVFQHYALWPHLDVAGNVGFPLVERRVSASERAQRIAEALALVELPGVESRRVDQLSGGQQQRVALARALVARPRLLLLDEPLANLDPRLRGELRNAIRAACRAAGVSALLVTHDADEALAGADRVAVMQAGRILQVDEPRLAYGRPVTLAVARALGPINELECTIENGQARSALGALPAPAEADRDGGWRVAVRPECLRLVAPGSQGCRCSGTIIAEDFGGAVCDWRLRIGNATVQVRELAAPRRALGDVVGVSWDELDVQVLAP